MNLTTMGRRPTGPIHVALAALRLATTDGGDNDRSVYEQAYDGLLELAAAAKAIDHRLDTEEQPPTGDDYNDLYALLQIDDTSPNPTLKEQQQRVADEAFSDYDFGETLSVEGHDGWSCTVNADRIDMTRVVYVRMDDDEPSAPSQKVSFRVVIAADKAELIEVGALWCQSGGDCGCIGDATAMALVRSVAKRRGWNEMETAHAIDNLGTHYGDEVVTPVVGGRAIHTPAQDACDYVRIVDEGYELAFWISDEWRDDPKAVMGAVLGCIGNPMGSNHASV